MAVRYTPKIVTDGLVMCLDAANPKSYPGSGTAWYDLSKNNNHATLQSGPTFSSANGGIIVNDTVDDYIQVNNSTSLQMTTGFTLGIWVKFNNILGVSYRNLIGKPHYMYYGIIVEWYGNNPLLPDFYANSARHTEPGLIYPSLTDWNYVVHSYNSTGGTNNQAFYVWNSSAKTNKYATQGNLTVTTSTDPLYIGQAGLGISIGPVWVYNKGLTESEVLQNYNATKSRFGL